MTNFLTKNFLLLKKIESKNIFARKKICQNFNENLIEISLKLQQIFSKFHQNFNRLNVWLWLSLVNLVWLTFYNWLSCKNYCSGWSGGQMGWAVKTTVLGGRVVRWVWEIRLNSASVRVTVEVEAEHGNIQLIPFLFQMFIIGCDSCQFYDLLKAPSNVLLIYSVINKMKRMVPRYGDLQN